MIYISLPFPVVPRSKLKEISTVFKEDLNNLVSVHGYCAYIDPDFEGHVRYMKEKEWLENCTGADSLYSKEEWSSRMGSSGILKLAQSLNKEVPTINCIYVPGYIWNSFKPRCQRDISKLLQRVEEKINRYKKLIDLGAPEIIIRNECRMLEESVYALEDNSGSYSLRPYRDSKGMALFSLKDVNFDLSNYEWIDPLEDEDSEDRIVKITPPQYFTEKDIKTIKDLNELNVAELISLQEKINKMEDEIKDLKSLLNLEKERNVKIKEERDKTVQKLSKENLKLDHRIDQLIKANEARLRDM